MDKKREEVFLFPLLCLNQDRQNGGNTKKATCHADLDIYVDSIQMFH